MINRILILALTAFIASCASTGQVTSTAQPTSRVGSPQERANALNPTPANKKLAAVYIVRDNQSKNKETMVAFGLNHNLFASLKNNSFTRVDVPPGIYYFNFAVDVEDFNKRSFDEANINFGDFGRRTLLVKADEINVISFTGGANFNLAKETLYGYQQINQKINATGAYYMVPMQKELKPSMNMNDYFYVDNNVVKTKGDEKRRAKQLATRSSLTGVLIQPHAGGSKSAQLFALQPNAPSQTQASVQQANKLKQTQVSAQFAALQKSAKCKLKSTNWVYAGNKCKNGLAHGKGSAVDRQNLKFIGDFVSGQRVKGEIHKDGSMIFSGSLVDDKPEGGAICFYKGEYEECRFFKGKRIDTLYKIRKENAEMKEQMNQMQASRSAAGANASQKGVGDYAADALKREAADRAASFIFDQLF